MNRDYPVLRFSVQLLRRLAYVPLVGGAVVVPVFNAIIRSGGSGIVVSLMGILYGLLGFWLMLVSAELLRLGMDVEENTRRARDATEALAPEPDTQSP